MSYKKQLLANQQLREKNLKLKVKNSNKISDAIRDVDFGIIPNIQDNRTRNEIIQDEFKTQETTISNANRIFDNNAQAVQRFMTYLGADKYLLFNRYFANIYTDLKSQLPYIQDSEISQYVLTYLRKYESNAGIRDIVPTGQMLEELITKISNIDSRNKIQKQDLLYKLEALQVTLENTNNINKNMYEKMNLPTSDELNELLKTDDSDETINSAVDVTSTITAPILSEFRKDVQESLSEDFSISAETPTTTETMTGPDDYFQSDAVTDIMTRVENNKYYSDRQEKFGSNSEQFKKDIDNLQKTTPRVSSLTKDDRANTLTQLNRISRLATGKKTWAKTLNDETFSKILNELDLDSLSKALQSDKPPKPTETRKTTRMGTMADITEPSSEDASAQEKEKTGTGIRSRRQKYKSKKR